MSRSRVLGALSATVVLAVLAAAWAGDPPLTTADLVRFLRAGIGERTILAELRERGFGEPLDDAHEAALREAGASETLVVAVRRAVSEGPAPVPSPSPGADEQTRSPRAARPRGPVFGATARSVRVPVSVFDKAGVPVLGLRGADFRLTEDGRPQPVTFFSGERRPLRIALALDISASMRDEIDDVAEALRHFIDVLEPADEVLVLTFSSHVQLEQDFTSDREQLERVFSRLQADQGTALYDAVIEAIRRVAPQPSESKAVVLVTDGVDTSSRATFEDVREIARRSEVPIFSIGLDTEYLPRRMPVIPGVIGRGRPRRPGPRGWPPGVGGVPGGGGGGFPGGGRGPMGEPTFDARPLLDLAEDTGGRAEILRSLANVRYTDQRLKQAVESIAVTLRHRYLVGYEPGAGKRGWRKIGVKVARSSVKVHARKGYYAEGS